MSWQPRVELLLFWLSILTGLVVVATGVLHAIGVTIDLSPDPIGPRREAIAGHALRVAVWGVVAVVGLAVSRRWYGWLPIVVVVWVLLLSATEPGWWPELPSDRRGMGHEPAWLTARWFLWSHVAAVVLYLPVTFRKEGRWLQGAATVVGIGVVVALGVVNDDLHDHHRAEQPTPTAEGRRTLAELAADPLWSALPSGDSVTRRDTPGAVNAWGEALPARIFWRQSVAAESERAAFEAAVGIAEESGWRLVDSSCLGSRWSSTHVKEISARRLRLRIDAHSLRDDTISVSLSSEDYADDSGPQDPCW